jgi:hypothetical protein
VDDSFYSCCGGGIRIRVNSVDRLLSKLEGRTKLIKDKRQNLTIYSYDGAGRLSSVGANNGFTLGIRAPGQTYSQCLAANAGNYSVYNWLPSSAQNGATKFALGNDVSGALFGDANEGTAGLLVGAGVGAAPLGVGTAGTFGRRTASIFNLNLSGTTGPAPTILGKTGAAEVVGWVSGAFELKLAADIGATAAEALNCIGHR